MNATIAAIAAAGLLAVGLACGEAAAPEVKPPVTPQIVYVEVTSTPEPDVYTLPDWFTFSNGRFHPCLTLLRTYDEAYETNKGSGVAVHRARRSIADVVGVTPLEAQDAYDACDRYR